MKFTRSILTKRVLRYEARQAQAIATFKDIIGRRIKLGIAKDIHSRLTRMRLRLESQSKHSSLDDLTNKASHAVRLLEVPDLVDDIAQPLSRISLDMNEALDDDNPMLDMSEHEVSRYIDLPGIFDGEDVVVLPDVVVSETIIE